MSEQNTPATLSDRLDSEQKCASKQEDALRAALVTLKAFLPEAWATINAVEEALHISPQQSFQTGT